MTGHQVPRQLCRSLASSLLYQLMFLLPWGTPLVGEAQPASPPAAGVPSVVKFSGTIRDAKPRPLILSVPYALKAGEAATVGGLPPSAFILAASYGGSAGASPDTNSAFEALPLRNEGSNWESLTCPLLVANRTTRKLKSTLESSV